MFAMALGRWGHNLTSAHGAGDKWTPSTIAPGYHGLIKRAILTLIVFRIGKIELVSV
jgi:hypothetical protein